MDDLNLDDLNLDDLQLEEPAVSAKGSAGGPKAGKPRRRLPAFLIGLLLGVAGTILVPTYLGSYLPSFLRGETVTVEGPVLAKQRPSEGGDRLLLTVQAAQGAMLVTFTERVSEIDLLVDEGDVVSLGVKRYEPFVENPAVRGVEKNPALRGVDENPAAGSDEASPIDDAEPAATPSDSTL